MAYKRKSPMPIVEGGSNATTMATTNGVIIYDGTRLVTTGTGTAGQWLTSNGAGVAPTYQAASSTDASYIGWGGPTSSLNPLGNHTAVQWLVPYDGVFTIQSAQQVALPCAGTVSNLYINVTSNASTTNVTVTLYKNSAATLQSVTITALTTGTFSDLAHPIAFAQGDLLQWNVTQAATGDVLGIISSQFLG